MQPCDMHTNDTWIQMTHFTPILMSFADVYFQMAWLEPHGVVSPLETQYMPFVPIWFPDFSQPTPTCYALESEDEDDDVGQSESSVCPLHSGKHLMHRRVGRDGSASMTSNSALWRPKFHPHLDFQARGCCSRSQIKTRCILPPGLVFFTQGSVGFATGRSCIADSQSWSIIWFTWATLGLQSSIWRRSCFNSHLAAWMDSMADDSRARWFICSNGVSWR